MHIEFRNVTKRFPGVVALRDVSFGVREGTCHALVGENGAGKSTLGRILAGICAPNEGEVWLRGDRVRFHSPREAMLAGVGMVHQELLFCENLTVAENLCLGQLPRRGPFVSQPILRERARVWLDAIQAKIEVDRPVGGLSVSQQQLVQIAAAVARGARVLVFDEPTSSLSQAEAEHLFTLIAKLKQQGVTSIYISHRLEEIFRLCDAITVLRDGEVVATKPISEVTRDSLVQMMIGRALDAYFPAHLHGGRGGELLRVENLASPGKFENVSFSLRAGEVLGLAGLVGAGRTELTEALFGLDPRATGRILHHGERVRIRNPREALRLGIGLVPEDRKRHGLVLSMRARENISLPILNRLARFGWVRSARERSIAKDHFERLRVRATGIDASTNGLSGGNQQKLVIARWLAAECKVLIVDEPTRGVDVGAKAEIHALIDGLARDGNAVLLVSSELPEIIHLSTRILVLRAGRIVGEVMREEANQDSLMRMMAGIDVTR